MENEIRKIVAEYHAALHAMQSGVAFEIGHFMKNADGDPERAMAAYNAAAADPKHLRVGVNAAMVDSAALGGLLIEKGLITELEYVTALRDGARREAARYRERLAELFGVDVERIDLG